jgi:glycosyltransferase involved in cell wall biosynthesis
MPDSHRIAWFTPLRPVASGISQYNEELLGILGRHGPIDVFVDDYQPEPFQPFGNLRIFSARRFKRIDEREPYALVVYQLGNSPAHLYMYDLALRRPGLLVLHDTMLHHLMLATLSRRGGAKRYRTMMGERYGADGLAVAERVLKGRIPESLFDYPLAEELIDRSRHVIVHSEYARAQVLLMQPNASVSVVPMGIRLPPFIDRDEARRRLDLPLDLFIVASITQINPHKRIDVALRSLQRLRRNRAALLLIAGNTSPNVPLSRWIGLYGLTNAVETLGYVDDRTARLIAAAADAIVNLRYPTAGETSASLLRLMAAGRPVLVSDTGSFRELPDDVVAKVPLDLLEEATIEALFDAFVGPSDLAQKLGTSARVFVEREHSLNAMVAGYARVIGEVFGLDLPVPPEVDSSEPLELPTGGQPKPIDPTVETAARAMIELGLAGNDALTHDVAESLAELGLSPAKMEHE